MVIILYIEGGSNLSLWELGEKRGAGVPGCVFHTPWDLVENAGYDFFLPKYEFSSLKWKAKIVLAYIEMNINSAPRPQMRCSIKKAN